MDQTTALRIAIALLACLSAFLYLGGRKLRQELRDCKHERDKVAFYIAQHIQSHLITKAYASPLSPLFPVFKIERDDANFRATLVAYEPVGNGHQCEFARISIRFPPGAKAKLSLKIDNKPIFAETPFYPTISIAIENIEWRLQCEKTLKALKA